MRWDKLQRFALPPKPKRRGWGSPLAALMASDGARVKPPISMPVVKFLERDEASDEPAVSRNL
jgi:hypothetical protein